jgi:hypothetical protein
LRKQAVIGSEHDCITGPVRHGRREDTEFEFDPGDAMQPLMIALIFER